MFTSGFNLTMRKQHVGFASDVICIEHNVKYRSPGMHEVKTHLALVPTYNHFRFTILAAYKIKCSNTHHASLNPHPLRSTHSCS